MTNLPIAIQLYSVRDDAKADFLGTLKKIKDMGYDGVEFAGLYGYTYDQVKQMCQQVGLVPVSAHVAFVELMEDPENIIAGYKSIGCKQVVIPYLMEEYRPGNQRFNEIIEGAKILGEVCKKQDMLLAYHNHDFEYVKLDGEYALDVLYKEVPADLLQTQIDTCWTAVAGEDPVEYVRKYSGRMYTLHLKDYVGQKSNHMYALIGINDDAEDKAAEQQAFELRPVGYGKQNFPEIIKAAQKAGAEWLIVEQDRPSMDKTPLECAQMSISYLKNL